jgi:serine/threonine protein kinase
LKVEDTSERYGGQRRRICRSADFLWDMSIGVLGRAALKSQGLGWAGLGSGLGPGLWYNRLVHCDVKPGNILLHPTDTNRLNPIDYGLYRAIGNPMKIQTRYIEWNQKKSTEGQAIRWTSYACPIKLNWIERRSQRTWWGRTSLVWLASWNDDEKTLIPHNDMDIMQTITCLWVLESL